MLRESWYLGEIVLYYSCEMPVLYWTFSEYAFIEGKAYNCHSTIKNWGKSLSNFFLDNI